MNTEILSRDFWARHRWKVLFCVSILFVVIQISGTIKYVLIEDLRLEEYCGEIQSIDRVQSVIDWRLAAETEVLELHGSQNLTGRGAAAAQTLNGNAGDNVLYAHGMDAELDTVTSLSTEQGYTVLFDLGELTGARERLFERAFGRIFSGELTLDELRDGSATIALDAGIGSQLFGGLGNDTLYGDLDDDYLDGGAGDDLHLSGLASPVGAGNAFDKVFRGYAADNQLSHRIIVARLTNPAGRTRRGSFCPPAAVSCDCTGVGCTQL